jgi:hypothetical protein
VNEDSFNLNGGSLPEACDATATSERANAAVILVAFIFFPLIYQCIGVLYHNPDLMSRMECCIFTTTFNHLMVKYQTVR